ncbi:DUF4244 domain-containing protein [Saccharothrix sp. Mg75]|uniref:DUF4244 domain-containing protein n=1 Tax=Saccharothrix sp. Mg75 TaxID=3445357 RepID=UPI003EE9B432
METVGEEGMSTAEYAIGTLAAAAVAMVLYGIATADWLAVAVQELVQRAFTVGL